ncbi:MAG: hypothetical protein AB8G99_23630 [Planctomycetaceae bacterium]
MLTDFEYQYLRRNKRHFKMTRAEAAIALESANVPQLPAFVDFQSKFGGYSPDSDVTYGIVGTNYNSDGEPRSSRQNDLCFARCDLNNRIQIRLRIDENGLFYYEDRPVAESFESYIRFKAYCSAKLQPLGWTFIDHQRRETRKTKAFLKSLKQASAVDCATDNFHSVFRSDQYFQIEIGGNRRLFVRPDLMRKP